MAKDSESKNELVNDLADETAFHYGKNRKKILIKRQRKQYIKKCIKLGFLDEDYNLTPRGKEAINDFDRVLSDSIFNLEYNGKSFKELLLKALSEIRIPTVEEIKDKFDEYNSNISIHELRSNLNILAKCDVLRKNRKYTYSLQKIDLDDFENIISQAYYKSKKDPTGLIWFEEFRENIIKKYNLTIEEFDELFNELKKNKPRLISIQRGRDKTYFKLRD